MIKKIVTGILKGINKRVNPPNWKNLRHLNPISDVFGYDRGDRSIYRYYIDKFIESHSARISGSVLEVGDSSYMNRYSQQIAKPAIIHYAEKQGENSFVGDLTRVDSLPQEEFDCFICTQTFNFIHDFGSAVSGSHYLLKKGGYLLATVSGIQQISKYDASRWGDYWRFTGQACVKSFGAVFGEQNIEVVSYGNVLACIAGLEGLSSTELNQDELDYQDPCYEMIIGICAKKV
jgi:Methyltransferase domain